MKQTLRQSIIAARSKMPEAERAVLSTEIARRVAALDAYREAGTVLGYMNFGMEFESALWVRQALADGKRVLLPKVNRATNGLDVYRVTELNMQLAPGAYGIREPLPERCALARLDEVEFMLLPGVAFGRDGARLGYGGGYYDKLLARLTHRPTLAAAAFAMQVVEGIPMEPTDQRIDWLVTESETIDCRMSGEDKHG